jgi:hypothetical protein
MLLRTGTPFAATIGVGFFLLALGGALHVRRARRSGVDQS